jgi:5-(carboxyamino)imidazole ribonucleotide mutase
MIASATALPVIGVPVVATALAGVDALLSIVQMPGGVPVATVAIGNARNAGLLAVRILGAGDDGLRARMEQFQRDLHDKVRAKDDAVRARFALDAL